MTKTTPPAESELGKNWKCPYCGAHQVLLEGNYDKGAIKLKPDNSVHGKTALQYEVKVCANQECRKMTLSLRLMEREDVGDGLGTFNLGKGIKEWTLAPSPSTEKVLSDKIGIPAGVREDYAMAARLCSLAPRASTCYARKAIGGMLRDFCEIDRDRLADQIVVLRALVRKGRAPQLCYGLAEIDLVLKTGNIGKHMGAGRDTMTEADEGEPDRLLGLIEQLAEDWYAVRQRRLGNPAGDCCRMPAPPAGLFRWR